MESGFGFLRQSEASYMKSPKDIYISPALIKSFRLKKGDTVAGFVKAPRGDDKNDKFKALVKIVSVNYQPARDINKRKSFDSLTPIYPDQRFDLENPEQPEILAPRILNLFAPIGKGQRSLIVAPPRTGKTVLLQNIANSIVKNHPDVYLIVLLIDERPEEVTDMQRSVRGEVISSTFDEEPDKHCHVAEIVLEKAKKLVETGYDVVILLDSITRLARAYNQNIPASGKVLSGGVDAKALIGPKKFFGAARNIEHGGSLTIIGTALIDTGSRMDEVIFEEFKGTGNMEVYLDRNMAEKRLYPAIDIFKSGTRKEELLLDPKEMQSIWYLREQFSNRKAESADIAKIIIDKLKSYKTNKAFLSSIKFNGGSNV
jgi:transcription termination factor Rho